MSYLAAGVAGASALFSSDSGGGGGGGGLSGVFSSLGGAGGLFGAGGETRQENSQSTTTTTSLSLTNLIQNLSPQAQSSPQNTSSANGSTASGTGGEQPSPLISPYGGFESMAAEENFKANAQGESYTPSKPLLYAGSALLIGVGVLAIMKKGRK